MAINEIKTKEILNKIKPATLVAATKYASIEELYELEKLGVEIFGENQVQVLIDKYNLYKGNAKFHMIGTLQTNKVKYIIDKVELIHSVANYRLIDEINKQASKRDIVMDILIQINIAKEESKHGFIEEELDSVFNYLKDKENVNPIGFMIMAPNIDPSDTEIYFENANKLLTLYKEKYKEYDLKELSMGMSNDYEYALKHGATYIRVGSLLFDK